MSLWRSSSASQKQKSATATDSSGGTGAAELVDGLSELARDALLDGFETGTTRNDIAQQIKQFTKETLEQRKLKLNVLEQRNLTGSLTDRL